MTGLYCRFIVVFLLLTLVSFFPTDAASFFGGGGFANLPEMTDAIAAEMQKSHAGKTLYLNREDIHDSADGAVYPFSTSLANELGRALSKAGFGFVESSSIDKADLQLVASFHKTAESVKVYLKLKNLKQDNAYRALKGNYEITPAKLPPDSFTETFDNRIAKLAGKIAAGWQRSTPLKLFVRPMLESGGRYSSPFAEYVTGKLKARLAGDISLRIVEEKPVMTKAAATRSILPASSSLEAGDAVFAGADALLESTYLRGKQAVSLTVKVKGIDGAVRVFAEESIPAEMIHHSLENETGVTLAKIVDTEHEQASGMISVTTTKGGGHQVYHDGEIIQFNIRTGKPLYLYVYNINPKEEASLLFPKAGEPESPKNPGINHLLPGDADTWEIRVEPPYGMDAVKVFASERKIPLPRISDKTASRSFSDGGSTRTLKRHEVQAELAVQGAINTRDLVDYYKGIAAKMKIQLYETSMYVETRAEKKK